MKPLRMAGALAVLASLAAPAAVLAHPSVYTDTAKVADPANPPAGTLDQVRYVVSNHGFTYVLRETNDLGAPEGVFTYSRLPNPYRGTLTWPDFQTAGGTGAQAHATCHVPQLESEAAIKGWQGTDPFYDYVPFQKESAGLEDDPAAWIEDVKTITGVDLASATDLEAACEGLPGADANSYVPADTMQTTAAALAAGTVERETAPLTAQIAALTSAVAGAKDATAAIQALLDAARAEITKLTAAATPLKATLPSARLKARTVARQGAVVSLTGVAGARASVELAISERRARRLGLKSSVLAAAETTLGADGAAQVTLRPGKPARKALRKLERPTAFTVTAAAGDRFATSGGSLTR